MFEIEEKDLKDGQEKFSTIKTAAKILLGIHMRIKNGKLPETHAVARTVATHKNGKEMKKLLLTQPKEELTVMMAAIVRKYYGVKQQIKNAQEAMVDDVVVDVPFTAPNALCSQFLQLCYN